MKCAFLCVTVVLVLIVAPLFANDTKTAQTSSSSRLKCEPRELYKGDLLTLRMQSPHGRYLAVVHPDGTYFFVIYPGPEKNKPSLMDSAEFKELKELKLKSDTVQGAPWVFDRKVNEMIFTKTGKYRVLLSDNLESEDQPVDVCNITYVNHPREDRE